MWQEFKPTLYFLLRFFGTYIILSLAYGLYIKHYDEQSPALLDPFTRIIINQVGKISSSLGYKSETIQNDHLNYPKSGYAQTFDSLLLNDKRAIAVEEGCNGLNVMIMFVAFIFAFGGWKSRNSLWFLPLGLIFIHFSNLLRLFLLAWLNVDHDGRMFHFFHKYGFTAVSYASVFLLWFVWVRNYAKSPKVDVIK